VYREGYKMMYVFDERDFRPNPVRVSRAILSPDSYIISITGMKTHDRSVVILSLKNIVFGAPIKDPVYTCSNFNPDIKNDKPVVHGSGFRGINYNLYALASTLHPHPAVIDRLQGMEGNGPIDGTPVNHGVCVYSYRRASTGFFVAAL
jgi:uncharacterized protein (DUF362 family)